MKYYLEIAAAMIVAMYVANTVAASAYAPPSIRMYLKGVANVNNS